MDVCLVCGREGTDAHPLSTSGSGDLLCPRHLVEIDGVVYSPMEISALHDEKTEEVKQYMRGKHSGPPPLTSVPQIADEIVALWEELDRLSQILQGIHENLKRIAKEAGVI